jgi:hypothetical protein
LLLIGGGCLLTLTEIRMEWKGCGCGNPAGRVKPKNTPRGWLPMFQMRGKISFRLPCVNEGIIRRVSGGPRCRSTVDTLRVFRQETGPRRWPLTPEDLDRPANAVKRILQALGLADQ